MMPSGAVEARGLQITSLMNAARERLLGPATERALKGAATEVTGDPQDSADFRDVNAVRQAMAPATGAA